MPEAPAAAVAAPPAPTLATPPAAPPPAKVDKKIEHLINRHGSAEAALATIASQLVGYEIAQEQNEAAFKQLRERIPAEGTVVLTPEQKKQWDAFQALKLTPEQVVETVKERDTLKGTVHTHGIEKLAREAAPNIGYDPEATVDLITGKQLHVELREVEVEVDKNGKKEKVKQKHPFVRPAADERAQLVALTEYAKTLPAFEQRALQAAAPEKSGTATSTATPYPESRPTPVDGNATSVDTIMKSVRDRYPLPSELRKQQQPATQGA